MGSEKCHDTVYAYITESGLFYLAVRHEVCISSSEHACRHCTQTLRSTTHLSHHIFTDGAEFGSKRNMYARERKQKWYITFSNQKDEDN